MRRFLSLATIAFVLHAGLAGASETPVAEVSQLRLYSSFWQNLHHFLYVSAWATRTVPPGGRRAAMPLPAGSDVSMTPEERTTWDQAVALYDREYAQKDLLFDRDMLAIKRALADADDTLAGLPNAELRSTLLSVAPIYRKHWWTAHDAVNRAWIADAARRAAVEAPRIIPRLTALYGVAWFSSPVRVDVVRAGKSQGAYTSTNPPHIVVASADESYADWASTEMLFHESSHALIQNVEAAVDGALRKDNKRVTDLWHVVLFYMAGEVTRQQLAIDGVTYTPYLYKTGLFDRAWPQFKGPVETHVRAYIDGKKTLAQMATDLAAAVP